MAPDLARLWAQVGAIALVLSVGTQCSLFETREAYYEHNAFADIFAEATRAPESLRDRIAAISGVVSVETCIRQAAVLDIEGMAEPASGILVSVPDDGVQVLNKLYMRLGRLPEPGLAEGDRVVMHPSDRISDGVAITLREGGQ